MSTREKTINLISSLTDDQVEALYIMLSSFSNDNEVLNSEFSSDILNDLDVARKGKQYTAEETWSILGV